MAIMSPFSYVQAQRTNDAMLSGSTVSFYLPGTTTPVNVFSDIEGTNPLGHAVTADSEGYFPIHYLPTNDVKAVLLIGGMTRTYDGFGIGVETDDLLSAISALAIDDGQLILATSPKTVTAIDAGPWVSETSAVKSKVAIVDTLAALRLVAPNLADSVLARGHSAALDGGGGVFSWSPASAEADDDGRIVTPSLGGTGRWKAANPYVVYAEEYGAKGDDSVGSETANNVAFVAAYSKVVANGRGILKTKGGQFRHSIPLVWSMNGFGFDGGAAGATVLRPTHTTGRVLQIADSLSIIRTVRLSGFSIRPVNTRTAGANIDIQGAADVHLTDIEFGGYTGGSPVHGGFDGVNLDTFGNQSGLHLAELRGYNLGGDGLILGKNSSSVINEVFFDGGISFATINHGVSIYCASGLYGGGVSIYQAALQGILFAPVNSGIFDLNLSDWIADTCGGAAWEFVAAIGSAASTDIKLVNCSGHSSSRGFSALTGSHVNGLLLTSPSGFNNVNEGFYFQDGKKITVMGGECFNNSTTGSAVADGLAIAATPRGVTVIGLSSGLGGIFEQNSITNNQRYGISVDNSGDDYTIGDCFTRGNVTGGIFGTSGTSSKVMHNNRS